MDQKQSVPAEPSTPLDPAKPEGFWQSAADLNRVVMSAAPLGPIAVGIMIGVVAGERAGLGPVLCILILATASSLAISSHLRDRLGVLLVLAAGVGAGGILRWSREGVIPPTSIEYLAQPGETIIRVRGQIATNPTIPTKDEGVFSTWQFREDQTAFLLRVESIESENDWRIASGTIKVTIREAVLDLNEGDSVELFGRLVPLAPSQNPGAFDWRAYYRQQGVVARMYCDQRENVVRLGREGTSFASWLRSKARGLLTDDIASSAIEEASLLEAMVLGHRSRFDRRLNEVFTRAGCVHFIAASGTNIVVLMGALWFAGRMVGLDKRRCAWVMIVAIILYGVVAEARPPILRACVMGLMFCIALLLQRASSHFNWICAAAIILCLIDPMTVFDAGFQLSFAAVLGVAYLAPAIWQALKDLYWWFRQVALGDGYARADLRLRKVAEQFAPVSSMVRLRRWGMKCARATAFVFALSLGAWLSSLPITAQWFQRVQPWGVISSVLIYPLMSIVMVLGLVKVGVAVISPSLAWIITCVLGWVDTVVIKLVERLAELPAASPAIPPLPWWLVSSFYLFLIACAIVFKSRKSIEGETVAEDAGSSGSEGSNHGRRVRWVLAAFALFMSSAVCWCSTGRQGVELRITILTVGAGSAMVVELPNGETILYDAGSLGVARTGTNVIAPFLRHRGIRHIDRLYLSHPNLDHFSGVPELLGEFPTGPILRNHCFEPFTPTKSPAARLLEHLRALGHPMEMLDPHQAEWKHGAALFETLWPPAGSCTGLTANESSTVLRLTYAGHSILFTGDIEEIAERELIKKAGLSADVLLLPHHGSVCASTKEFLKAVNADVLVRSSSERMADTSNGLQKLIGAAEIYNTADCGAVTLVIDGDGLRAEPWHACTSD